MAADSGVMDKSFFWLARTIMVVMFAVSTSILSRRYTDKTVQRMFRMIRVYLLFGKLIVSSGVGLIRLSLASVEKDLAEETSCKLLS